MANHDNVVEFPAGVGVAYRTLGLVLDGRLVYRPAFAADLISAPSGESEATLDNWEATTRLGWEF